METNWNQLIERYLNNELSAEGKAAFEAELDQNTELQNEFELHQLTKELIQRGSLRTLVKESGKWFHLKKLILNSGIVVLIAGALAIAVYFLAIRTSDSSNQPTKPQVLEQSLLEKLEKTLAFDHIDPEYFQFTGKSDVFLSESGVLLSLTDESFLLEGKSYKGAAIVQWQEAQSAADIIKAGLSTKSGDELLETQGMFSLNAFTPEGKKLQLSDKGIYVQVPVDELKKDMKLFAGVPQKNGTIDWQAPVELERLPKPKDMAKMDLFPPRYEPKLNELKWYKEKSKRDSLYLSFEEDKSEDHTADLVSEIVYSKEARSKNVKTGKILGRGTPSINYPVNEIAKSEKVIGFGTPLNQYPEDLEVRGKLLFETKCMTCHSAHRDGTGPKLFQVREKWANGGAKEGSIYQWVADWNAAALSDPYAREVTTYRATGMNKFPELKGKVKDIDAIFDYIDCLPNDILTDSISSRSHIPPSKVLAIWKKQFNNTNLATQDFEDRMKEIHNTCDEQVFDIYAKNLNEPLWKLDERVVKLGYPQFKRFAEQKVGKIQVDDVHQQNLAAFYEKAVETLHTTGRKNVEAALKKDQQWDQQVMQERDREVLRQGIRASMNATAEADFNLAHLSKQLGQTLGFMVTGETVAARDQNVVRNWVGAPAKQELPVVVNIDRLTKDLLSSRKSVDVFTMDKGKKATIRYSNFMATVESFKNYDRLYFYLLPKELNSYERLNFVNGKLNYPLNKAISYSGLAFGMNEKGYYLFEVPAVNAKDLGSMKLQPVSEKQFEARLKELNANRGVYSEQIAGEINWLFKEKANYQVQRKRRENEQFRNTIRPTIYSCLNEDLPVKDLTGIELNPVQNDVFSQEPLPGTDNPPSFPGGIAALRKYLDQNIQIPKAMEGKLINGKVIVRFIVDENGKVTNAAVKKGIPDCPECDQEALRAVKNIPAFIPATANGKNVATSYSIPISFRTSN